MLKYTDITRSLAHSSWDTLYIYNHYSAERCIQCFGAETRRNEYTWKTKVRWEDNINVDLKEVGCGGIDWIDLTQERDRWRTLVNTVMNIRVP